MLPGMRTTFRFRPPPAAALAGWVVLFSVVWSSAFVAGKIGLRFTDPLTLLALRFALAAALLLPACLPAMARHLRQDRTLLRDAVLLGVLNNALYLGLTFQALRFISPELVIIVVSCAPFLTCLIAGMLGLERIGARTGAGIAIGFGGVLLITLARPLGAVAAAGLALAALGTACFAAATVFYRHRAAAHAPQQVNFWQSLTAAALLLPFARMPSVGAPLAAVVAYLAAVVTVGGMWLWMDLIRRCGAATASAFHLANPLSGLLLAHLVLGSAILPTDLPGIAAIVGGILLATRPAPGG